jgi:predicted ArsR family transcriptional regulator
MSSESFENYGGGKRPAERVLMALKMGGPLSSAVIGMQLGTTGEAARQQLARLAEEGLVEARSEAAGVGRPTQLWQLTPKAERRFPDTHAALTVQLLAIVREQLGDTAIDTIISTREKQTATAYREAMEGQASLCDRVAALARLRAAEGYMAEWWEEADGSFMLVENHCPICAAATACQGFCRAELEVFQSVLGAGADIRRSEHIPAGARRCAYVIRPA